MDYRHAKVSDIPRVAEVFATAIDDIDRKHGFYEKPTPKSPPSPQYAFWLKKNPGAFWVAEDRGQVVGYTFSFLRGPLWFLADLFILPEHQGKGIGGTLIKKTLGSWRDRRITNRALITPAFNRASVSLYMRYEMLPRQPVYFASATREAVERGLQDMEGKEREVEDVKKLPSVGAPTRHGPQACPRFSIGMAQRVLLRSSQVEVPDLQEERAARGLLIRAAEW